MFKRITVFYFLGEDFTEGSVIFHLPPGINASAYRDIAVISDKTGRAETFHLEPHHLVKGGKEVHLSGVTGAENGVVMLFLEEKYALEPGYYEFRVTADADGVGGKLATEDEYFETAELFIRIAPEYEGILEVSPRSAKAGTLQTLTLTYSFGDDFNGGWVEFSLPKEMAATAGRDTVVVNGEEKILTEANISDGGQKLHVGEITAKKGDTLTLKIFDKRIPASGPYFFNVRVDADGEEATKPATLGSGGEFTAFLAYSEVDEDKDIVEQLIKAINRRDFQLAIDLLADDVVYVKNYMDGYFEMYQSKEEVAEEIGYMMGYDGTLENDENTFVKMAEKVWQVKGIANDYFTRLTAELNPDDGFGGFGYTTKYFVTDNKICYIEFLWNREDEILYDKLNEGAIGLFTTTEDSGEVVITACMPGMPAEKAGLLPGDILVAVDGMKIEEMEEYGYAEARMRIIGKTGTKVKLTIERNGEVFDVEIEREAIW